MIGFLHLPETRKKVPLVILVHGWSGNSLGTWNTFFVRAAREICKNGYGVLRFDFRGSGNSEGAFKDQTISSMLDDLKIVIEEMSKDPQLDTTKTILIGHSQGMYVSLFQAARDERIQGIISWEG